MIAAVIRGLAPYAAVVVVAAVVGVTGLYALMRRTVRAERHASAASRRQVPDGYWDEFTSEHEWRSDG